MKRILFVFTLGILFTLLSCKEEVKEVETETPKNLASVLAQFPDSIPLLIDHGKEMILIADYETAMANAAKAFRLDTNNLEARILYAEVLNNRPTRTVSDVSYAQNHYSIVVEKQPKNLKALIGLAATYSQQFDFESSFKYINQALRINPRYRDAYVLKGSNYRVLGNTEKAKSSYETAIQQDPSFLAAYIFLGTMYQSEKNPICLQYFTTAYDLDKNDMEVVYSLAYAKEQFGEHQEAKYLYRIMTTDTSVYYSSRGLFHQANIMQFEENNLDSAVYFYTSATTTFPKYIEAWHNLGLCYTDIGDRTSALKSFAKALSINPEYELSRNAADELR